MYYTDILPIQCFQATVKHDERADKSVNHPSQPGIDSIPSASFLPLLATLYVSDIPTILSRPWLSANESENPMHSQNKHKRSATTEKHIGHIERYLTMRAVKFIPTEHMPGGTLLQSKSKSFETKQQSPLKQIFFLPYTNYTF